jgi:excisionase family DNA binding protein
MAEAPQNGPRMLSPSEAAEVLDLSKRRVLRMLERRELVGERDPETGRWSIPVHHVEALREHREK